jgi:hypothetical protein
MSSGADLVERVRRSVAATRGTGTASIRYVVSATEFRVDLDKVLDGRFSGTVGMLRRAGAAARPIVERFDSSWLPGPDGRLDFRNERSVYSAGSYSRLFAPGLEYQGEPGAWEADEEEDGEIDDVLPVNDPLWLVALVDGAFDAVLDGNERVLRAECQRYRCKVSLERARTVSPRPLATPVLFAFKGLGTSNLEVNVWIDSHSLVRQITLRGPGERQETTLQLAGFGEAAEVEIPAAHEVLRSDGQP